MLLQRFMQPNAPISAKVLIVEGWIPIESLIEASQWARIQGYEQVFTTGGVQQGEMFIPKKGELSWEGIVPVLSTHALRIKTWGSPCQGEFPLIEIWIDSSIWTPLESVMVRTSGYLFCAKMV